MKRCTKHDWSYDQGIYPTKRICIQCGRKETKTWGASGMGIFSSEWYVSIDDRPTQGKKGKK